MCQLITIFDSRGKPIGRAFQCSCNRLANGELESMEDRWIRNTCEAQRREMEYDEIRRRTKLFDPDRRFKPRNEMRERNVINLGHRQERVPATARHF